MSIGSVLLYIFVVYPLLYATLYRIFVQPIWEITSNFGYLVKWIVGTWEYLGWMPESLSGSATVDPKAEPKLFKAAKTFVKTIVDTVIAAYEA
jgi:hypothetical protein